MEKKSDQRAPGQPFRVAVVEDEGLYRDLLRVALSASPRISILETFRDGESALKRIPALKPDAVLLDIDLGEGINGIQLGLRLRQVLPDLGVVLLTNHRDPAFISSIPSDELSGWCYLLKRSVEDLQVLERAIEGSVEGLVVLDPGLTGVSRRSGLKDRLTPRQWEILNLIVQGYSNAAIAEQLVLSPRTVENQIRTLYQELGIDTRDRYVQPRVTAVMKYLEDASG